MSEIKIRPLRESDREWIGKEMRKLWSSEIVISRGRVHHARDLPGFVAESHSEEMGFALYHIDGDACECELVVLFSLQQGQGVGANLVTPVRNTAIQADCARF